MSFNGADVSYRELRALVEDALRVLDGLTAGRPVGLHVRKSPESVALVLACWAQRRPFLLPPSDLGTDARAALYRQAGCGHVVHADLTTVDTGEPADEVPDLGGIGPMLTTSGSTGLPKVVPLPHDAVDRFTDWAAGAFDITGGSTVFNYAPLNFDLCLLDIWTTLRRGGQVVLADQERALDARYLLRAFTHAPVEVVQAVPLFYRRLLEVADGPFPSVRELVHTGDAMPPELLARLPELFPKARIRNVYGCTETNDSLIHDSDPTSQDPVPIGRPIDGVEVRVDGAELLVRTPFQAGRYLDTAITDRWVELDGHTWLRTGDLVRRDADGVFHLDGRADHQVKVRGVRTNPRQVEAALQSHPEVAEVVVLALPDDEAGYRLHALVRAVDGTRPNSLSLRSHCARLLPRTAVPSSLELATEEFPRTSTGKVDRTKLLADRV
ncbi:acyl-coenzyme A synthetase/AMP-(fatty) acid ligase [Actinokineospora baliensis]|uniref:AMP-binding protein n=1 Tax=Actinokineospora baliensis TaxID=547056 RepID=UPI00195CE8DA|nr:AMP-binding protein [Actinokineospora baliensis]MBM7774258.1 acyl-coenzyme A synthetase/AMP-(fatty) acid ligase [Actinokineospora baliensis]